MSKGLKYEPWTGEMAQQLKVFVSQVWGPGVQMPRIHVSKVIHPQFQLWRKAEWGNPQTSRPSRLAVLVSTVLLWWIIWKDSGWRWPQSQTGTYMSTCTNIHMFPHTCRDMLPHTCTPTQSENGRKKSWVPIKKKKKKKTGFLGNSQFCFLMGQRKWKIQV